MQRHALESPRGIAVKELLQTIRLRKLLLGGNDAQQRGRIPAVTISCSRTKPRVSKRQQAHATKRTCSAQDATSKTLPAPPRGGTARRALAAPATSFLAALLSSDSRVIRIHPQRMPARAAVLLHGISSSGEQVDSCRAASKAFEHVVVAIWPSVKPQQRLEPPRELHRHHRQHSHGVEQHDFIKVWLFTRAARVEMRRLEAHVMNGMAIRPAHARGLFAAMLPHLLTEL